MFQNTLDGLAHPLILETAKNLAYKQVGLGFCRPQDHQDLMQDLLLYLCKQVSRYTGELDLVTWACRLLHGRINRINRRLLGIPSPSQQRRSPQPSASAIADSPATPATTTPTVVELSTEPVSNEAALPEPTRAQTAQPLGTTAKADSTPAKADSTPAKADSTPAKADSTPAKADSAPAKADNAQTPVRGPHRIWQRLRQLGSVVARWWQPPP